jgi:queuine tRNA-ribosyltransferase
MRTIFYIIFAFDEATSPYEDNKYQAEALSRTHAWAKRSLEEHKRLLLVGEKVVESPPRPVGTPPQQGGEGNPPRLDKEGVGGGPALFGIVQGGLDPELRKKSAEYISSLDFDGFGIGGSYTKEHMEKTTKLVNEILPEEKPRHLLGIGEPEDLFMGVENGVDLFDCVAPTRIARNGTLYTSKGKINILNAKYREDFSKLEENCECYFCENYTVAYLSHLFHAKEMLAATLATAHNLYFIINLMKKIRQSIVDGNFFEFKDKFLKEYLHSAQN